MQGQYRVQGMKWDVTSGEILSFEEQVSKCSNSSSNSSRPIQRLYK